ncbi:hypothetical protein ETSB_0805 [cyanobacterium endosymbiont of Epithemia turgida isolate EtSB Lake Yunoko]|nr:hypothetical protein ETSB_0805 [cyanobacterium endosymbiont of Epithemia turgida isolate EtSB Lake Yunoko]
MGVVLITRGTSTVLANIDDDILGGNICVVYGRNGSLVSTKLSLTDSFKQQMPTALIFCLGKSQDCKQFVIIVS